MIKLMSVTVLCLAYTFSLSQTIEVKLVNAVKQLEADSQLKHATISLYVIDSKTGKPVFDKNSQVGLAPASCLKVVTSASAFELLGKDFRYKTDFTYDDNMEPGNVKGNLVMKVSGDPTLGSWRWEDTKMEVIKQKILAALKAKK